jgi:hypothetical protein
VIAAVYLNNAGKMDERESSVVPVKEGGPRSTRPRPDVGGVDHSHTTLMVHTAYIADMEKREEKCIALCLGYYT